MITNLQFKALRKFFQSYSSKIQELENYKTKFEEILKKESSPQQLDNLIDLYHEIYPVFEKELWESDYFDDMLKLYQNLFQEQELLIQESKFGSNHKKQYDFILSIPIADRPEHLRGCLESIYQLCSLYSYGGYTSSETGNGFFSKITVVIVEDSKEPQHIEKDIELALEYTQKGLRVHHYGLEEQYQLMMEIPEGIREEVSSIIGDPSTEKFFHKGQAVTRNLSYLKALQLTSLDEMPNKDDVLFYFVDSDQQFRVNRTTANGDEYVYGLNYFYYINHLFCNKDIAMLTGKLVCDPPVSPSVMSGNFLDDIIAFFEQLSEQKPEGKCHFHPVSKVKPDDAAYHDMAHLFGLGTLRKTYDYCCSMQTKHDHVACLKTFSNRINYFFFGEHLTRKTYFSHMGPFTDITPARTIYPGNYITTFDGLKYIIPFGKLRLRMSGPTAGRLIQSEIGERFASVNLPMLHARTLQSDFKDEYRPGVEDNLNHIDLTDEFERQFFGDLMLFTVVRLCKSDIDINDYNVKILSDTFAIVEEELLELYEQKHNNVLLKCDALTELLNNKKFWWNQNDELTDSMTQVHQFIKSVQYNFDEQSNAYQQIQSEQNRQTRIKKMISSLLAYRNDRDAWDKMLVLLAEKSEC
ncbi:MAG: hypothetical protein OQL19_09885 [Gammaproteobacteria bacterium]|nr:hypothetical protein [Gammaproteobacteria bacterium]